MLMAIVKEKLKIIGMAHNNAQVWLAMQMYDCDPNLALDYLVVLLVPSFIFNEIRGGHIDFFGLVLLVSLSPITVE